MRLAIGLAAIVLALSAGAAQGQPADQCADRLNRLLNRKVTASGPILKVQEIEILISIVLFRDAKTGCQLTALEGLLDDSCKPGKEIAITGVLKKASLTGGYEIVRGEDPPAGTLTCR